MTIYVCTTDTFLSGWGMSEGLINKLIILCDTPEEAEIVADYAENRDEQDHVSVSSEPPLYYHKRWRDTGADYRTGNYSVQIKTREDMPIWFEARQ